MNNNPQGLHGPRKAEICRELCRRFTDDDNYFTKEMATAGSRVLRLALTPEHMTGKLVNES